MTKASKYSAPALDKGLDIIEYLSASAAPRSQAEIALGVGRSANEIYRVLIGLEARRYLIRDEASGKYYLSLKLFTLAHTHSPVEQLRQAAQLPMSVLVDRIGQSCHLGVIYKNKLLVVSQIMSPAPVALSIAEGTLFPLLTTTSGRVLLANVSGEQQENILLNESCFADMNKLQQSEFRAELANIKGAGFNLANSEITSGVTDCAAFVGQTGSGLMAAIAVSSLTSSLTQRSDSDCLIQAVMQAAAEINERIGL